MLRISSQNFFNDHYHCNYNVGINSIFMPLIETHLFYKFSHNDIIPLCIQYVLQLKNLSLNGKI